MNETYKKLIKRESEIKDELYYKSLNEEEKKEAVKHFKTFRTLAIVFGFYFVFLFIILIAVFLTTEGLQGSNSYCQEHQNIIDAFEEKMCDDLNESYYGGYVQNIDKVYNINCENTIIKIKYGVDK